MKKLRIHYLQHVPFEGLGYIETWSKHHGHTLSVTKLYEDIVFPKIEDYDWLIVMGGPMGVYEEILYPWLSLEKKFIREAINANKTIIGICLGAQLIANVLGARVYPNSQKEIGWFPATLTPIAKEHTLFQGMDETFPVFHWHGDTFDLPAEAIHLLQTDVCKNQAFLYKNNILGFQFHPEATPETLAIMLENCSDELVEGEYIQPAHQIMQHQELCKQSNTYLERLLDRMANL